MLWKSEEIKQNWTIEENFDNYFYVMFDRYYKSFISGWKTAHFTLFPPNFGIFLKFLISKDPKSQLVRQLVYLIFILFFD